MELIQIISYYAITIFCAYYLIMNAVSFFRGKYRLNRMSVYKNSLRKGQIDIWNMEATHAQMELDRKEMLDEKDELENKLDDLNELKEEKEAELAEMKKDNTKSFQDLQDKNAEITEIDEKIGFERKTKDGGKEMCGIKGELVKVNNAINWFEQQMGELTKQMSIKQRSLDKEKDVLAYLKKQGK